MKPLRVCIDARISHGVPGGIEQFVIGMAHGLSRFTDGDEEYFFLATPEADDWIRPHIAGPCRLLHTPPAPPRSLPRQLLDTIPGLRSVWDRVSPLLGQSTFQLPRSDGTIERAGIDIMHLTLQSGLVTDIPSIYHPHDLQHIHFPEYFTPRQCMMRSVLFEAMCAQARMVSVTASWGKQDLVRSLGIPEDKIEVVPLAPPLESYATPTPRDLADVREKFSLPERYIFYPAQAFPHKNHLRLLDALALLDKQGTRVHFVSSGRLNSFYLKIKERVRELGLEEQTQFLGFVTPLELQCLYRLSTAVVVPSKFEAASFPLWEAFYAGIPAACSAVTSLPQQAGDAALLFDPDDAHDIATVVARLWRDEALRRDLADRGRRNVTRFTWTRTTRQFRAHYRRLSGRPLTEADRAILMEPPLL